MNDCTICYGSGTLIAKSGHCANCGQHIRVEVPGRRIFPLSYPLCPGCGSSTFVPDERTVICMACGPQGERDGNV